MLPWKFQLYSSMTRNSKEEESKITIMEQYKNIEKYKRSKFKNENLYDKTESVEKYSL